MDKITIDGMTLNLTSRPEIRCQYERGVYPLSANKAYYTPVYATGLTMKANGFIKGTIAQILQFKGSFAWQGINWDLVELDLLAPTDAEEAEGIIDIEVSVSFVGGGGTGIRQAR
jgi:hypothetical protein